MLSVKKIASDIKGTIKGDKNFIVKGVCDLENGENGYLTYLKNSSYSKYLETTNASVIIIDENFNLYKTNKIYIKVDNAGIAFSLILQNIKDSKYQFNNDILKPLSTKPIGPEVKVGKNVSIGKNVFIDKNTEIMPGCFIGDNVKIGKSCKIYPNVTIYDNVIIGNECKIDSGTVIGADGFGLLKKNNKNFSIPHIGNVIIGKDVYIGANCCIDRGTINNTIIEDNCRLDNLVQIGHNVSIGKGCVIAGQVGIAGSASIGKNVTIAGQSGIIDHICIGDDSIVAAKSLVCKNLDKGSFVSGNPARNHNDRLKQIILLKKLPEIITKISND